MLSLKISSTEDELDLGALLDGTEGVQAVAGLTGAGLPPVSVQWSEGAGDGATYRGKRVLPRNIDIPLFVAADDRAGLRDVVKRLAMILADEATLTMLDSDGDAWTLKVVRVGGGDFAYGFDTDGELDLELTVTLRAGQPYWTAVAETVLTKTTFTTTPFSPYNAGSVDTPPLWEVRGPGKNLVITSPSGERLSWDGELANGETLFIDSSKGTVKDGTGASRYANLATSPRFAKVKPLSTAAWTVEYPNLAAGLSRTNLCANPDAIVNVTGWTAPLAGTGITKAGTAFRLSLPSPAPARAQAQYANVTVTAGSTYAARTVVYSSIYGLDIVMIWLNSGGTEISRTTVTTSPGSRAAAATAPVGAAFLRVQLDFAPQKATDTAIDFGKVLIEKALVAGTYFDGNTTDTASNAYAWTGTAGSSTSTLTVTPDRSTSQVICRLNPRDWMVV